MRFLWAACSFLFIFPSLSQEREAGTDPFKGLVEIIIENEITDSVPLEVPMELSEIILDYYAEETVPLSVTTDVLSYLSEVYSEHGYNESGNWAPVKKSGISYRYVPYKGDLPEYKPEDFRMPATGRMTSGYGYRPSFRRFHHGVDIALNFGDTVRAALPGVVIKTGYDTGGYGRYVVVTHAGGIETLYGHLNTSLVNPGQKVSAGDPVGFGGSTGNSTGPHLHFETRYRGVPLNPLNVIRASSPMAP